MTKKTGYRKIPLTFNRRAVIASATVTREKNTIHGITEIDIHEPRRLIREHLEKTGEKLSLTAYIVTCLAQAVKEFPQFNSFCKGRKLVILDDITISVLIERDIQGEKVPEPIGISKAQEKTFRQIHDEIREAQKSTGENLGSFSGMSWVRLIPNFLFRTFVRVADKNIGMAKRYGKVAVTAVGMFSKNATWFIPHGSATVLLTVGGITEKTLQIAGDYVKREHLCLTVSFDHDIVDGAPAARFITRLTELLGSGEVLPPEVTG